MAVWALLSISQTGKAVNCYITGYFVGESEWTTLDGKNMESVVNNKYSQTYQCTKSGEYRFRFAVEGWKAQMCPDVERFDLANKSKKIVYTDQNGYGSNYFYVNMENGKTYTFTFDDSDKDNRTVACTVSGSSVVTKVIKLFNGLSEVTDSNGKYTLNLSGDTSQDATITLTIDGAKYGLATAQTISKAGTTLDIAFTTEGKNALTLKAGLIYYLSVKEDGKMKVVAKEKGIANGNYYLVGNFFTEDGNDINYDKKYFRFIDNGDGTLSFDIPTTLTVKAQVLASDGTRYGPTKNGNIGIDNPTADGKTVNGNLVEGSNCFTFTDRELTGDGIYKVTIAVDETGIPTKWTVDFDKTQRMAYFMVDPKEDPDAVAHPCYTIKNDDGTTNNAFFGNVYLEANQHCFVVGNIQVFHNHTGLDILKTTKKLYLQGNGGLDITTNTDKDIAPGHEKWEYTNVFPNKKGFYFPKTTCWRN